MSKVHDNWNSITFCDFDAHANAYIAELVDELLREKGIEPSAFAFSINVDYMESEDE
jgi:hypothetical protein